MKKNKTKTQHNICWKPLCANNHNLNKSWSPYTQLEVMTNLTSFVCGNRNGHHNTELGTQENIYSCLNAVAIIFVILDYFALFKKLLQIHIDFQTQLILFQVLQTTLCVPLHNRVFPIYISRFVMSFCIFYVFSMLCLLFHNLVV